MKNNKTKKRGGQNVKNKVPNGKNSTNNGKKEIPLENQSFMTRAAQSGLLTEAIFTGAKLMGKAGKAGFNLAKNASKRLYKPKNKGNPISNPMVTNPMVTNNKSNGTP